MPSASREVKPANSADVQVPSGMAGAIVVEGSVRINLTRMVKKLKRPRNQSVRRRR